MAKEGAHVDVVVGTYEELILGYQLLLDPDNVTFTQNFTNHNHTGCIKSVALSQRGILASGATDETIWLFNLKKKNEIGSLVQHSGSITCLEFYKNSHLFSTSEDAQLCVWKSFTWECLKTFKGHTGCISSFSVHPSGKLALTVGKDRRLHTWNLIKGRSAYVTNIKQPADIVAWSTDGSMYLIVFDNRIDFYKVEATAVFHSVKTDKRVNAVTFLRSDLVAYGGEGGAIVLYNVDKKKEVDRIDTETVRIRGLVRLETSNKAYPLLLISASSDGYIKAYSVAFLDESVQLDMLASHNSKFRLTCLAAAEIRLFRGKVKLEVEACQDSGVDVKDEDEDVEIKEEDISSDENAGDRQDESSDNDVEILEDSSDIKNHEDSGGDDDDDNPEEESSEDDDDVEVSSDDDVEVTGFGEKNTTKIGLKKVYGDKSSLGSGRGQKRGVSKKNIPTAKKIKLRDDLEIRGSKRKVTDSHELVQKKSEAKKMTTSKLKKQYKATSNKKSR